MQIKTILRILGVLLMMFSLSMLSPIIINFIFNEHFTFPFFLAFLCTFTMGAVLWFLCRHQQNELKNRDGFLIVVLFWFVLCFCASFPFLFSLTHPYFTDALFESVSGFTTTGATIIPHLHMVPKAILFYRQQLQFFGGMGIIVLAVAILPMLGVGGMQLYRAETPGPMKDSKLTPRIAQTAKALWFIYVSLTFLCVICYWLAGMSWFNALGEGFATVSTGGFSMHDNSFAFYNSEQINIISCLFMLLGASSFSLHFLAFKHKNLMYYWQDEEFRSYLIFLLVATLLVTLGFMARHHVNSASALFLTSLFNVISFATTTGFVSDATSDWPAFIALFIFLLTLIGGCAASTSGGIKMLRTLLIFKQSKREITRLLHPNAIMTIKFGHHVLPEPILQSMWSFISVFIAVFWLIVLLLVAFGNDFVTAFSATTAALTNSGVGIGHMGTNFSSLSYASKWVLIFAMIAGRLEIFSLLILFSRHFWQK